jgi:outer membrane receptor for ferrienterochelin and colicin
MSRFACLYRAVPSLMAVALLFSPKPALAAIDAIDMTLDELVKVNIISTPKFAENPDQIPSIVSILTAEDIRLYGWRTLGDALRTLQGFNVTDDATYSYAGVRGISAPGDYRPRLQILIDGMSVNDNIYASSTVDSSFPLDIGLIERIEVIRGPSASIYGGDAMFGVINIVTRNGHSINGSEIGLSFGSGADRRLRATCGGQVGSADVLVSATGFDVNGRSRTINDVTGDGSGQRIHGIGGEDGNQLFIKARGTDWSASFIHAERDRIVPHGSYGTIPDDSGHVESDHYDLFQLAKNWRLDAHNTLEQRFNIGAYGYDGKYPYDYSSYLPADPRLINVQKARGSWWSIENRLINTAWSGQRLTFGIEYKVNSRQDQLNFDQGYGCYGYSSTPCLEGRQQSKQLTLMAQDEIQIGASSLLTLGISHNQYEGYRAFWSPRIGFIHDAGAWGLFKTLYGTAFRVPSVFERLDYSGYLNLRPEAMRSLEFSWEKRLTRQSRLSATIYHFHIKHIVTVDNTGLYINGDHACGHGAELEYEHQWANGSRLRTNYSVQYASDENQRLDNSPRHMAKLNLAVPAGLPGLTAAIEGQWIASRLGNAGSDRLPSYALANFNLRYAPAGSRWDIALGIYNLFDRRYSDPVDVDDQLPTTRWQLPQQGRSAVLRTTLHF